MTGKHSASNRSNGKTGTARQPALGFLVALVVAIVGSGSWNAQAATLGQTAAQAQAQGQEAGTSELPTSPDATCPAGGQCFADVISGNPFYDFINRIYQQDLVSGYACGGPGEPCDANNRPYYRPGANVTRQQMAKFIDNARRLPEIHMQVASGNAPIYSRNDTGSAIAAYSTSGQALVAQSQSQSAIYAQAGNVAAISAYSTGGANSIGVSGSGGNIGVKGSGVITGVLGIAGTSGGYGVYGTTSGNGTGVYGLTNTGTGVIGYTPNGTSGVAGSSISGTGVSAHSSTGTALFADSTSGEGVHAVSSSFNGVHGISGQAAGVYGESTDGNGIYANSVNSYSGYFQGDVHVVGNCCGMGAGTTQIDDPLDPAHKYLNQSLVQSPDMATVLNGDVTTDAHGEAIVTVPAYFQASNGNFRYQLTAIGGPGPNLYIAQKLQGNTFKIAGGSPNLEVSWQVTGIRQDPYALAHPIQPEQDKPAAAQGKYVYPTEQGQPESLGVDYDRQQQAKADLQQVTQTKP